VHAPRARVGRRAIDQQQVERRRCAGEVLALRERQVQSVRAVGNLRRHIADDLALHDECIERRCVRQVRTGQFYVDAIAVVLRRTGPPGGGLRLRGARRGERALPARIRRCLGGDYPNFSPSTQLWEKGRSFGQFFETPEPEALKQGRCRRHKINSTRLPAG